MPHKSTTLAPLEVSTEEEHPEQQDVNMAQAATDDHPEEQGITHVQDPQQLLDHCKEKDITVGNQPDPDYTYDNELNEFVSEHTPPMLQHKPHGESCLISTIVSSCTRRSNWYDPWINPTVHVSHMVCWAISWWFHVPPDHTSLIRGSRKGY